MYIICYMNCPKVTYRPFVSGVLLCVSLSLLILLTYLLTQDNICNRLFSWLNKMIQKIYTMSIKRLMILTKCPHKKDIINNIKIENL